MPNDRKKRKSTGTADEPVKTDDAVNPREYSPASGGPGESHGPSSSSAGITGPNPRDATFYYLRGLAYERCGDRLNAIINYDSAIALDPKLAWAYYHRALAHAGHGNGRKRSEDLEAAARLGLRAAQDILTAGRRAKK